MPRPDYDARTLASSVRESPDETRHSFSSSNRRRSGSYYRNTSPSSLRPSSWHAKLLKTTGKLRKQALKTYSKLTPLQRIGVTIAGLISLVLGILFLVYNERIFRLFVPYAKKWREIPAGWLILWAAIFIVSFPPLLGYSTLLTIAGFVYGFPNSWFIVASATVAGSTASFLISRSILKTMVHRLVAKDARFAALALTLKHDGLKILIMIRLCPLPYSLSNGALATVPTVQWLPFMLASAIASPKLLVHVFIGSRLGEIAERGEEMDTRTKMISYITVVLGGILGTVTGALIYRQTKRRARELEGEERASIRRASLGELEEEYADDPAALEAAERLREDESDGEDDISLHSSIADHPSPYHDDMSDEDVFKAGDGEDERPLARQK